MRVPFTMDQRSSKPSTRPGVPQIRSVRKGWSPSWPRSLKR